MLSAARVRRCILSPSVWTTLNYPVYIPIEQRDIVPLLLAGDATRLAAELRRRISPGSASAAALLGFLELMGAISGIADPQAAITCCSAPAKAGSPYAQYVLSWAYWHSGRETDALRWMKRPAAASFLPALVDSGRMLANLAGDAQRKRAAVRILWGAHRLGHAAALGIISGIALRGDLGLVQRLLGVALFPYAMIRGLIAYRCAPFAITTFTIDRRSEGPLLSSTEVATLPAARLAPEFCEGN